MTVAVVIANGPVLVHLVTIDPLQLFAWLPGPVGHQVLPGRATIDPNAGYVTQALGRLVATDWLHGTVPWWNPYEGLGAPLAAGPQAAAFFPLTMLVGTPVGYVAFRLLLELVAGWSAAAVVGRLGAGRAAATAAGVATALNGTFAWFDHAPASVAAFLPMAVLGVERCRQAAAEGRRGGWCLLALALALSMVAGFPETAYLDGLFVGVWAALRLAGGSRWRTRFVVKLGAGAAVAGLLAAPALVAFAAYLPEAFVGPHAGQIGSWSLPSPAVAQLLLPYVYGPIFALHSTGPVDTLTGIWGTVGGYLGATTVLVGLTGLVAALRWGGPRRVLGVGLGAWTALALAKMFGASPVAAAVTRLPGMRDVAFFRYATPSVEFAAVVLAALGIDAIARRQVPPAVVAGAALATLGLVAAAAWSAWPVLTAATGAPHRHAYPLASALWAAATVAVAAIAGVAARARRSAPPPPAARAPASRAPRAPHRLVAAVLALDAMVLFAVPLLSAPTPVAADMGAVRYLQRHLGLARFTTLGPLQPNYGSFFGMAELAVNDLPVPAAFARYASTRLDPNVEPDLLTGTARSNPSAPGPAVELWDHLPAYEDAGVAYVVVPASGTDVFGEPFPPPGSPPGAVRLAYRDRWVLVYRLAHPAPFFAAVGSACTIAPRDRDEATVRCAAPATVVRRELVMSGWRASVSGHAVRVRRWEGTFQAVPVPAGASTVRFRYEPPAGNWLFAPAVAGLVLLAAAAWRRGTVRRVPAHLARGATAARRPRGVDAGR